MPAVNHGHTQLVTLHGPGGGPSAFAVASEADISDPVAWLSASELERFKSFRFEEKARGFLLGRLAAKRALSLILAEFDFERISIETGAAGEPLVRHNGPEQIAVTLSHSHGLGVALAFPEGLRIGLDLEWIKHVNASVIEGELGLTSAESEWLGISSGDRRSAVGLLWTAREALAKALRTGVNTPLAEFALERIDFTQGPWCRGSYMHVSAMQCQCCRGPNRILTIAHPMDLAVTLPMVAIETILQCRASPPGNQH